MPDKKVLAGGAVLIAAAFWFYIKPNYLDSPPPVPFTEEEIAQAARPTIFVGKAAGEGHSGGEDPGIVLNLKSSGATQSYVKVVMALEFDDPDHEYVGAAPHAVVAKNLVFREELEPEMHKIMDAITTTFGSKTLDDVADAAGREKLKEDLIHAVNEHLHEEKVITVYFSQFITQ